MPMIEAEDVDHFIRILPDIFVSGLIISLTAAALLLLPRLMVCPLRSVSFLQMPTFFVCSYDYMIRIGITSPPTAVTADGNV